MNFDLNKKINKKIKKKQEFRDAVKLRYDWKVSDMPSVFAGTTSMWITL